MADRVFGALAIVVAVPIILFEPRHSVLIVALFFVVAAGLELGRVLDRLTDRD